MRGAEVSQAAALAALDCAGLPLLLLAPAARLVHANRAAHVMLAAGRAFSVAGGALTVQRQADQDAIVSAVAATLQSASRSRLRGVAAGVELAFTRARAAPLPR